MKKQITSNNRSDLPEDVMNSVLHPTRTPLFQAYSDDRYHRQTIIKQIQERTERSLICYVSGNNCMIDKDDTIPFVDLLHNLQPGQDVDFLLHTRGGSIDGAEKLIWLLRNLVGEAELRIIVPDYAKSAGTLMVLGADKVVMSDMSELGPIDPQMFLLGGRQSVQNYLDAYVAHEETLKSDPNNATAQIMLGKLDPATLKLCETAIKRARQAAEKLLRRNGGNWTKTADNLLDTNRWLSHGQMISWEDALELELVVEHLNYHSEEWQNYWRIYCLQRLVVGDRKKLFESDYVSLIIGPD